MHACRQHLQSPGLLTCWQLAMSLMSMNTGDVPEEHNILKIHSITHNYPVATKSNTYNLQGMF